MNVRTPPKKNIARHTASATAGADEQTVPGSLLFRPPQSAADEKRRFPFVGIGASAGGLAAFEAFFSAMPADTKSGMTFAVVQHLAADHKSILSDLIKQYTQMPVYEVEDGIRLCQNSVYIIPPNWNMGISNDRLQLIAPNPPGRLRLPIDFFFRALARDRGERAICIVLSGTGTDGTLGIRAVKGEGGMVMAQDPDSADYDGMPRSAIATGLVDYVLAPAAMPARLITYVDRAFSKRAASAVKSIPSADDVLKKICVLLRAQTGHDFSEYKANTFVRRVERRMAIHQIERLDEYLWFQEKNPAEVEALFRDLLIGVTRFFRDPEAFAVMEKEIVPGLFSRKPLNGELRVWVVGCSTGEEAYSFAILIQEHMERLKQRYQVQLFATDIDHQAIEQGRSGNFSTSIVDDVSPERLARFFTEDADNGVYRIHKRIRDMLIFSEQDVIMDPPFSKLDLISCRNLLIYMNADLQKKIVPLFHYALNPDGALFMGSSETVGEFSRLFVPVDHKWKIYRRHTDALDGKVPALINFGSPSASVKSKAASYHGEAFGPSGRPVNLSSLTEKALLNHYAEVGVLVNSRGDILCIYGRTGRYLEPAAGEAAMNILSMARKGLRWALRSALHKGTIQNAPLRYPGLEVENNSGPITVDVTVRPVLHNANDAAASDLFLVVIEEVHGAAVDSREKESDDNIPSTSDADGILVGLKRKLQAKETYLQTALEELETANEELRSTNEEMQSINEELQSTNEEMQTSKEELQSVNEELATVNTELQTSISGLSIANDDMSNLLAGTGIGTLFLDRQLRIMRFTPAVTRIINLIATDVGRPVRHIVSNLSGYDHLVEDAQNVLDTLTPREAEVRTKKGEWLLMRILLYRTLQNVIEGVVVTFVDITDRKNAEAELRETRDFSKSIVATVREPLLVLDGKLRVTMANRAFYAAFEVTKEETDGRLIYDLCNRQWDIPDLHRLLEEVIPEHDSFDDFKMIQGFSQKGQRTMLLNARRVFRAEADDAFVLLAIEDITDRTSRDADDDVGDRGRWHK